MLVDTRSDARSANVGDGARESPGSRAGSDGGALSSNSERALRSDLAIYRGWCRERGVAAVPASPCTHRRVRRRDGPAARAGHGGAAYVASIAAAHPAPSGRTSRRRAGPVRVALKRMHRRRGRRQSQAEGGQQRVAPTPARRDGASGSSTRATARYWPSPTTRCCAGPSWWRCKLRISWRIQTVRRPCWCIGPRPTPRVWARPAYLAPDSMGAGARMARAQWGVRGPGVPLAQPGRRRRGARRVSRLAHLQADGPPRPTCPTRWSRASPGTARGWGRRRTWSRRGLECRPSCTRDGGRPPSWSHR